MDYILLGVGLLLTVGTGLFVASEFALVNLDRADLEARQSRGESRLSLTISALKHTSTCLLYTSPSPRDRQKSRMPSSA